MKEYIKPTIDDEDILIEDICINSGESADSDFSVGDSIMG